MLVERLHRLARCWSVRKWISVSAVVQGGLSENAYHRVADDSLDALVEDLEDYFEQIQAANVDIQYSQGVVTVQMGSKGTYVINKQAPNKQIWLSSPISGPFRYDYENGDWLYHRDMHSMRKKLTEELMSLYQKRPTLH